MIKFILYLLSISNIFLILFNNPSSTNVSNFSTQSKFLAFSSNQVAIQKIIFINIILFIIFNIICLFYL